MAPTHGLRQMLTCDLSRTLVYLECDSSMNTYEDKNGQTQSSLNLVQSKLEVLKRPYKEEGEGVQE